MIGSSRVVRVWAYPGPVDLRRGFDGLVALVEHQLGHDALSGDCFLFVSRDRRSAKVLTWDGTGLCIYQKRMGRGRFAAIWDRVEDGVMKLSLAELTLFLEGADLRGRLPLSPTQLSRDRGSFSPGSRVSTVV